LQAYLTADDISYERRIELCNDGAQKIFYCSASSPLPADQQSLNPVLNPILDRWNQLITNKLYTLTIKQDGVTTLTYNMNVTGTPSDPYTSNLPIEVKNTVVTPNNFISLLAG